MRPKINFLYNNKVISHSKIPNLIIKNVSVDRIINDVVERNAKEDCEME